MLRLLRMLAPLSLLLGSSAALAHPYLDVLPFPVASVESGTPYTLTMAIFPGDTPVRSIQLNFELSSTFAFGAPSGTLGDGFSLVYDGVADPLHFSVVGDFTGNELEAFGQFPVAQLTLLAGLPGETLSMLDSSVVVALEGGVPEEFELKHISNVVFTPVIVQVVPEPTAGLLLASGLAGLAGLARLRRPERR
jgi:hypothetical protein